jgi:hypothetical protein
MNGDLKQTFMRRTLEEYGKIVKEEMTIAIERMKVEDTGASKQSISYDVSQMGDSFQLELLFLQYLRFVDMGVGRSHPLDGMKQRKKEMRALRKAGLINAKTNFRKPKKVYSKVAYGKLGWLYAKLLYGYTEETIAALKKELSN